MNAVYWAERDQTWKLTFRHGCMVEHVDLVHFNRGPIGHEPAARVVAGQWLASQGALRYVCPRCDAPIGIRCTRPSPTDGAHAARVRLATNTP